MKQEKETIKKIIASMRKNRTSTNEYFNPSMIERKPIEAENNCEEIRYVVDWQMRHTLLHETPKTTHASD